MKKMHWTKKAVYCATFAIFIFIALIFLEASNTNPFDAEFVTIGGLILLICIVVFEINFATL